MYKRKLAKQHGNLSFPWCVLAALCAGCFCEGMFLLVCVVMFTTMEAFYGCWTVIAVVWLLLLLTHGTKENKKHCLPLPFLTFFLSPSSFFFGFFQHNKSLQNHFCSLHIFLIICLHVLLCIYCKNIWNHCFAGQPIKSDSLLTSIYFYILKDTSCWIPLIPTICFKTK